MLPHVDRRQFLRQGLTLVGGVLLLPVGQHAFGARLTKAGAAGHDEILELIGAFGRDVTYQGATVAAILNGLTPVVTNLRAEIFDFAAFAKACSSWRAYGLEVVKATGSTLTVLAAGQLFEIEALPPGEHAKMKSGAASGAIYAHDALSLSPGAKQAVDPLQAGVTLRLVRQSNGAAALGNILRGRIDAAECGLTPDQAFLATEAAVLAGAVSDSATADAYARTFFAHVTALASALSARHMEALATSRLISTSLKARLDVSVENLVRAGKRPFAAKGQTIHSAAHWLAGGLASEIQAGRGPRWIATDSMARLAASTTALAEAERLVDGGRNVI
jgi:hypothetical protein